MSGHVNKQQRAILLIALLGIRKLQGRKEPKRKRVLNFIKIKKLMNWDDDDIEWSSAYCLVGDNRISWRRKDFTEEGLIVSKPGNLSWGVWELSDHGLEKAEKIVKNLKEKYEDDPDIFEKFKDGVSHLKLSDNFFNLVLQLANNNFKEKYYPKN